MTNIINGKIYAFGEWVGKELQDVHDTCVQELADHRAKSSDGFDAAYDAGFQLVINEIRNWDYGISENSLAGFIDALQIYNNKYLKELRHSMG